MLVWAVFLLLPPPLLAREIPEPSGQDIPQKLEETQKLLSSKVTAAAQWLDSFFDDERSTAEVNRSRLKLRLSAFKQRTESLGFSGAFDVRVALPKFEKRLMLIISGNPDDDEPLDDSPLDEAKRRFEERDQTNLNLGLRFFPKMAEITNVSFDAGLSFSSLTPTPYVGGRYRRLFELAPWQVRFTQTARWYTDRGVEAKTRGDLERSLGNLFFRTSSELAYYEDSKDGWQYDLRFFLFQPIAQKRVLEYEWNNYFKTRPDNRLDAVTLRVRMRQQVWWEWFYWEIAPQVAFRDKDDWEFDPGILLRVEINFGFTGK